MDRTRPVSPRPQTRLPSSDASPADYAKALDHRQSRPSKELRHATLGGRECLPTTRSTWRVPPPPVSCVTSRGSGGEPYGLPRLLSDSGRRKRTAATRTEDIVFHRLDTPRASERLALPRPPSQGGT